MSKRIASSSRVRRAVVETLENRQMLSLVVDLRLPGGAKTATVSSVGQTVSMEVWVTAKGSNATGADEGFQTIIGSFLSTNVGGGAAGGDLNAAAVSPFDAFGSQPGVHQDLDGDGDSDVGTNDNEDGSSFFASRAGSINDEGAVSGNSQSWKVANVSFKVTSLKTGGTTNINFRTRPGVTALWREDGAAALKNPTNGSYSVGSPVVLSRGTTTTASVSGAVYNDANKNNTREGGEAGIGGVKLFLDTNKNGSPDAGEASTITDSGGNYFFGGLTAGPYRIKEVAPAGFTISSPAGGFYDVTLVASQNLADKNFANQGSGGGGNTASISGFLFNDGNKNGVFDTGETRLSARKMFLDNNKNGKADSGEPTATTNANGEYSFTALAAGTYRVGRADTPAGYSFSVPVGGFYDVTLAAAQAATGKIFGVFQGTGGGGGNTASISGFLFSDANKNGVFDTGDTRLSARKMFLDSNKNGKLDSGEPSALTNGNGEYGFTALAAGSYRVGRADTPAGYTFSVPVGGFYDVTLAAGQAATGKIFGVFQGTGGGGGSTASIAGKVFSDTDKDGALDAGEPGVASKKMYIDANQNGKLDSGEVTAISNASGEFIFSNLAAGTYRLRRSDVPAGFKLSTPASGFIDVVVTAGQKVTGKNFGAVPI